MNQDKAFGAYIGAAIGDAMGGPVECSHAARIQRTVGEITDFLPYNGDYSLLTAPRPGYALRVDAGAVTDDTFIRSDLTRYFIASEPPRDATSFANWLLEHADFSMWWIPAVEALQRVQSGEVTAETGGLSHQQGGGVGWWTPIGIMHAGDPLAAFAEAKKLCTIWKDPLEQDLLAAVQAGVAAGMEDGATPGDILETMLGLCGTLARKFLQRGIDIGLESDSREELIGRLYASVLVNEQPPYTDLDLPAIQTPLEDTDDRYASILLCEQVALAVAAFTYGDGDPEVCIPLIIMIGRDCDSSATAVGSWCGALHGESGLPAVWVNAVCEVNIPEIDIHDLATQLVNKIESE